MADSQKDKQTTPSHPNNETGQPGGGQGRKDEVGRSGVYPISGPHSPSPAEIRTAGAWGQGERGAAGYEDHGGSQLTYESGQLLGALEEGSGNLAALSPSGNIEISPEEWISFFDGFSRQHQGWLASIRIIQGKEQKTEIWHCRLEGISSDHLNQRDEIYLAVGCSDGQHLTHPIKNPMKVVFRRNLQGAHEGIEVSSADGTLTSVSFRVAAKPEALDGLLTDALDQTLSARQESRSEVRNSKVQEIAAHIPIDRVTLQGTLAIPESAHATVLFAHGSGSNRHSPRSRYVAGVLQNAGFATLLIDLLTAEEEVLDDRTAAMRFDIDRLARRLIGATWWLLDQTQTVKLPIGYFGASTGAAASLVAAADATDLVWAIVSRGGRPDLAGGALRKVIAPTLLIVGEKDSEVIELNRSAFAAIPAQKKLEIVPGATHLFAEPGALEVVAQLAKNWFDAYLAPTGERTEAA